MGKFSRVNEWRTAKPRDVVKRAWESYGKLSYHIIIQGAWLRQTLHFFLNFSTNFDDALATFSKKVSVKKEFEIFAHHTLHLCFI